MKRLAERGDGPPTAGLLLAALVASPVLIGLAYAAAASADLVSSDMVSARGVRVGRVLSDPATWSGLGWSVLVAAMATTLATLAAVSIAVIFRGTHPVDRVGRALAGLPLPLPHLVAAALGVWVLGQSGLLARAAFAAGFIQRPSQMPAMVYDRWGVGLVLTMAWKETAFLSVVATALLATWSEDLDEAGRTLGANRWSIFRRITWPLLWRGLLPAILSVFIFVAGSYEASVLLAPILHEV